MSKKYSVLNRINHDNADYEIGSAIELEDDQAAPLLKVNVIAVAEVIENPSAPELTDTEKADAIKKAMGDLGDGDATNWTKGGFPQTGVLSAAVGFEVKAGLRDALWAELKAAELKAAEAASLVKAEPAAAEVNGLSANATTETAA